MTPQEAIIRIEKHNEIHSKNERFAIHITEALKLAVEALAKRIPKKALWGGDNRTSWRSCPVCHSRIHNTYKFCSSCGQALDWS